MYDCSINSIGLGKNIYREKNWDLLQNFKNLCKKTLTQLGITASARKDLYLPIINQTGISKEELKKLPAYQVLTEKKQNEVLEFLQIHKLLVSTEPHPADLIEEEACQSVSMGIPTVSATDDDSKPYF